MPNREQTSESDSRSSVTSTSRSLLDRLKNDHSLAWGEMVRLYAPLVYHWCRGRGLAEHETADIVQDVFQAVVANIVKFEKDRPGGTFRGWLRTITTNKIHDFHRRSRREPHAAGGTDAWFHMKQIADVDDEPTADEADLQAENALFLRAIEMIRADFRPQTWQAFWRVVVDGKSAGEVGEELGMKPGTVRVAKSRVLQRLRQQLGDLPGSPGISVNSG